MCGIFGYAGDITRNHSRAYILLTEIAKASEVRGIDSTGFSARYKDGNVIADKMPVRASHFTSMSFPYKSMYRSMPTTFIGHTRAGTGSSPLINNNNHPFIGDRFNMVHNGVIPSWKTIVNDHKLKMDSETDSEVILRFFEQSNAAEDASIRESVEATLNSVWGNMAVALLDKEDDEIYLFRNENPITVFTVPEKYFGNTVYFFTSTIDIFERAVKRVSKDTIAQLGISKQTLDSNALYSISSTKRLSYNKKSFTGFFVYEIKVDKKFSKKSQYTPPASTIQTSSSCSGSICKDIYSRFDNPLNVVRSPIISKKDRKDMVANMVSRIDGFTYHEWKKLCEFSDKAYDIESEILGADYFDNGDAEPETDSGSETTTDDIKLDVVAERLAREFTVFRLLAHRRWTGVKYTHSLYATFRGKIVTRPDVHTGIWQYTDYVPEDAFEISNSEYSYAIVEQARSMLISATRNSKTGFSCTVCAKKYDSISNLRSIVVDKIKRVLHCDNVACGNAICTICNATSTFSRITLAAGELCPMCKNGKMCIAQCKERSGL